MNNCWYTSVMYAGIQAERTDSLTSTQDGDALASIIMCLTPILKSCAGICTCAQKHLKIMASVLSHRLMQHICNTESPLPDWSVILGNTTHSHKDNHAKPITEHTRSLGTRRRLSALRQLTAVGEYSTPFHDCRTLDSHHPPVVSLFLHITPLSDTSARSIFLNAPSFVTTEPS